MSIRNVRPRSSQNALTPFDANLRNIFGDFWGFSPFFSDSYLPDIASDAVFHSPLDIVEGEKNFRAEVDLPGFDPENINVEIEDNALVISGERESSKNEETEKYIHNQRSSGSFYQKIQFPPSADLDAAECSAKNGVLTIMVPKKKDKKKKSLNVKLLK